MKELARHAISIASPPSPRPVITSGANAGRDSGAISDGTSLSPSPSLFPPTPFPPQRRGDCRSAGRWTSTSAGPTSARRPLPPLSPRPPLLHLCCPERQLPPPLPRRPLPPWPPLVPGGRARVASAVASAWRWGMAAALAALVADASASQWALVRLPWSAMDSHLTPHCAAPSQAVVVQTRVVRPLQVQPLR